jgi:hypothetical protein
MNAIVASGKSCAVLDPILELVDRHRNDAVMNPVAEPIVPPRGARFLVHARRRLEPNVEIMPGGGPQARGSAEAPRRGRRRTARICSVAGTRLADDVDTAGRQQWPSLS